MGAQNGINRQLSNGLTDSRQRAKYFRVNRQGKEWLLVDKRPPHVIFFVFLLFLGMVMYANEVETKEK